jgi:hypothetical protein
MRVTAMLLICFTLAACASSPPVELPLWKGDVPPSAPTTTAAGIGAKQVAAEYKLTGPVEMSDIRPTDFGPGRFMMCIRGTEPTHNQVGYYAAFFDNDAYKGSRASAILEGCEKQDYHPVP